MFRGKWYFWGAWEIQIIYAGEKIQNNTEKKTVPGNSVLQFEKGQKRSHFPLPLFFPRKRVIFYRCFGGDPFLPFLLKRIRQTNRQIHKYLSFHVPVAYVFYLRVYPAIGMSTTLLCYCCLAVIVVALKHCVKQHLRCSESSLRCADREFTSGNNSGYGIRRIQHECWGDLFLNYSYTKCNISPNREAQEENGTNTYCIHGERGEGDRTG